MIFDVRDEKEERIGAIAFADREESPFQAYVINQSSAYSNTVEIHDGDEYVLVRDKEHAKNMIKALNKAIELGWLK